MKKKPKFSKIAYMLGIYSNKTIPQTYINEMSDYELLLALVSKINEVIEQVNSFDELLTEIQGIIDELDETIKQIIIDKLEEMYEDGSLAKAVAEILASAIKYNSNILDMSRMARTVTVQLPESQNVDTITRDLEFYSFGQGYTTFRIGAVRYHALGLICNNYSHFHAGENAQVNIYQEINEHHYEFVTSAKIGGLYHCDTMCAVPDDATQTAKIYCCPAQGQAVKEIVELDFSVVLNDYILEYGRTYNVPITDDFVDGIATYNNEIYCYGFNAGSDENNIYKWNPEKNTLEFVCDCEHDGRVMNGGIGVDSDFIYIVDSTSNSLYKFDKSTGNKLFRYQIPSFCNLGQYNVGEIESICVENGMLYMMSCYNLNTPQINNYCLIQFWKQSLEGNVIPPTNYYPYIARHQDLFVGGNLPANSNTDDCTNSMGNGRNNASFRCIPEAIDFIKNCPKIQNARIYVGQAINRSTIEINTSKGIEIIKDTNALGETECYIGAVICFGGSFISIEGVSLANRIPPAFGSLSVNASFRETTIYALNSVINLKDCNFPVGARMPSVIHALSFNRCIGNFKITDNDDYNIINWENVVGNTFCNPAQSLINGHGVLPLNGQNILGTLAFNNNVPE